MIRYGKWPQVTSRSYEMGFPGKVISYHIIYNIVLLHFSGDSSKTPAPQPLNKQVSFQQCCKCSWKHCRVTAFYYTKLWPPRSQLPPPRLRQQSDKGCFVNRCRRGYVSRRLGCERVAMTVDVRGYQAVAASVYIVDAEP